ncbi:MAG TPA: enoyl-CoA hydratase/isomerase family protein [Chloroflexota bacterium]|jgi:enoyl-CoA hydratase/carnithine racemase|nr:enoyl-CoA hydratase/isomerase family protein [Chloroflexota bacterium]
MEFEEIRWQILANPRRPSERTIGLVTLNRPEQLNALTPTMRLELDALFGELRHHGGVRVVVLTGAGRAFSTGGDLKSEAQVLLDAGEGLGLEGPYRKMAAYWLNDVRHMLLQRMVRRLEDLPQVTIAAINGWAVGAGLELCAACDIRVAAEHAMFAEVAVSAGFETEAGGARNLTKLLGKGRALDLLLTGRHVTAQEAERLGLVDRLLPSAGFLDAVLDYAGEIAAKPYLSLRYAKDLVRYYWLHDRSEEGWQRELDAILEITRTRDVQEGSRAFLERRPPRFRGPDYAALDDPMEA